MGVVLGLSELTQSISARREALHVSTGGKAAHDSASTEAAENADTTPDGREDGDEDEDQEEGGEGRSSIARALGHALYA